jgi:hypothetical protein
MGYTTDFRGILKFDKKLTDKQVKEYREFQDMRHEDGYKEKPSIWLQWEILEYDGEFTLGHDGGEKFYNYVEWLDYVIEHFFKKWGVVVNGTIQWRGEEWDDMGTMVVRDNKLTTI